MLCYVIFLPVLYHTLLALHQYYQLRFLHPAPALLANTPPTPCQLHHRQHELNNQSFFLDREYKSTVLVTSTVPQIRINREIQRNMCYRGFLSSRDGRRIWLFGLMTNDDSRKHMSR
jgi:hypothetical protein